MDGDDQTGELGRAGRQALADELYDLRCELALIEVGERFYTPERHEQMRQRLAALEADVGDHLDQLLADDA